MNVQYELYKIKVLLITRYFNTDTSCMHPIIPKVAFELLLEEFDNTHNGRHLLSFLKILEVDNRV